MTLTLERPIIAFDIESTGTDTQNDRIVELSVLKIMPDGKRLSSTARINPTIPISAGAFKAHGISDEDVKVCKTFAEHAPKLFKFFEGCDTCTFNGLLFDLPMLFAEFARCGLYYDYKSVHHMDACGIFKIKEERTLTAAVKFYLDKEHTGSHGAQADTEATWDVLNAQIERYEDVPKTVSEIAKFSNRGKEILDLSGKFTTNEDGIIVFNFGEHKGKPASDHPSYIDWMLNKAKFPQDTINVINELINKK